MAWEAREAIGIPPYWNYAGLRRNRSRFHYATLMAWPKGLRKTSGLGSVKKADTRAAVAPRSKGPASNRWLLPAYLFCPEIAAAEPSE